MAEINIAWVQGQQFIASGSGGHSIVMDAPAGRSVWLGFKPSELLLAALGGCTAVDVIEILRKKRQRVSSLRISVRGVQDADPPWAFRQIDLHFEVQGDGISPQAVECAINLSQEKYCSVAATVRGVATINTSYAISEESSDESRPADQESHRHLEVVVAGTSR